MYSISACGGDKPLGKQEVDDSVNIQPPNADKDRQRVQDNHLKDW